MMSGYTPSDYEHFLDLRVEIYAEAQEFRVKTNVDPTDTVAVAKWVQKQTGINAFAFQDDSTERIYGMSAVARAVVALWWAQREKAAPPLTTIIARLDELGEQIRDVREHMPGFDMDGEG